MACRTRLVLALLTALLAGRHAAAQPPLPAGFIDRVHRDESGDHRYVVYVPPDYSPDRKWPVVLYLHGAGGRGRDGARHLVEGLAPIIRLKGSYPALVVFPQCADTEGPILKAWLAESPNGERALRILGEIERDFAVDPERRVLAGWSMGGYGAWSLAAAEPGKWSAVVPLAGGGDVALAARLTTVPIWAIHGDRDRAILPEQSELLVSAVRRIGGDATCTEVPGIGHDVWKYALDSDTLTQWMLSPTAGPPPVDRLRAEIAHLVETGELDALQGPFQPALIVPRAVSIRVGSEALRTITHGIPDAVRSQRLDGKLDDLHYTLHLHGDTFDILVSGLSYEARLQRVVATTMADGRVRLQIGVQPLTLRIEATTIEGPRHRAAAGPVVVQVGHLRPVWFDLMLHPTVEEHQLRLNLLHSDFRIPDENWFVRPPEHVTAEGPNITPELVRTGIVGGLYVRRADVERQVRSVIPALIREVEDRIAPADGGRLARGIWPLPVFRPRLQFQLDDLAIDEDGISLSLDVAAAAINTLQAPREPKVVSPIGPVVGAIPHSRQLEIAIAPGLLEPLSQLLVDADAARIDVRDLPETQFAALSDPAQVADLLPDLKRFGSGLEVRTKLVLAAPFRIEQGGALPPAAAQISSRLNARLHIPALALRLSIRTSGKLPEWTPYAEFQVDLGQDAAVELRRPAETQRTLQFAWEGDAEIHVSGRFVDAAHVVDPAIDLEHVAAILRAGWTAWTEDAAQTQVAVPDVAVGTAALRIEQLGWRDALIVAGFATPVTRIANFGPQALEYEVRGPFSPWSDIQRLPAGRTSDYEVPYPLAFRRRDQRDEPPLTLPVGSLTRFENGVPKTPE